MEKVYHNPRSAVNTALRIEPSAEELSQFGENLPLRLLKYDFEKYRPIIERGIAEYNKKKYGDPSKLYHDRRKRGGGRPPLDPVLMFKVVLLGVLTRLSDLALSFMIADSTSYRIFLGVQPDFTVSCKTIWKYREIFAKTSVFQIIFQQHVFELQDKELMSTKGALIVDGSFVEAPKQRNSKEVNDKIKKGVDPELIWPGEKNAVRRRHKDVDASWTKKGDETHYGYKINVLVDSDSKLILCGYTSTAKMHDSQALDKLLSDEDKGRTLYGDSAYAGKPQQELTESFGLNHEFCEKGAKGHPLSESQKLANREKSAIRCRIEHIFGFIEMSMGGSFVRSVGRARAAGYQFATMFLYNLNRQAFLQKKAAA